MAQDAPKIPTVDSTAYPKRIAKETRNSIRKEAEKTLQENRDIGSSERRSVSRVNPGGLKKFDRVVAASNKKARNQMRATSDSSAPKHGKRRGRKYSGRM